MTDPNSSPRAVCSAHACAGASLPALGECLEHATDEQFEGYLHALRPGDPLTLRDTEIHARRFNRILSTLKGAGGVSHIGDASFEGSKFHGRIDFRKASFDGGASFPQTSFEHGAIFRYCRFSGRADFSRSTFHGPATFSYATMERNFSLWGSRFESEASFFSVKISEKSKFDSCTFTRGVNFIGANFGDKASFKDASFTDVTFEGASFVRGLSLHASKTEGRLQMIGVSMKGTLDLSEALFSSAVELGPMVCGHEIRAMHSVWRGQARISAAALRVDLSWARFEKPLKLDLRHATLSLEGAVFEEASSITSAPPLVYTGNERSTPLNEDYIAETSKRESPSLTSVSFADLSNLTLSGISLKRCRFTKSHNLERIRIDDDGGFDSTPAGWHFSRKFPYVSYWSNRRVISEECEWRRQGRWQQAWPRADRGQMAAAADGESIAHAYRSLRRSYEESRNEPKSAEFYYGEMEMRKNSRSVSKSERCIIWLYWAISGYGLRASRAFIALLLLILSTTWLAHYKGFSGPVPSFGRVFLYYVEGMLSIRGDGLPVGHMNGLGGSLRVLLKIAGPILLGLGLLAIRNRVKR